MGVTELLLMGVGLAMDAFCVSANPSSPEDPYWPVPAWMMSSDPFFFPLSDRFVSRFVPHSFLSYYITGTHTSKDFLPNPR